MHPPLGQIEFGAPDANEEFSWSLKSGLEPPYVNAFVDQEIPLADFAEGRKWIALGHKGSGKTALLRHLAHRSPEAAEYIIFRDEIAEEKDIFTEAFLESGLVVLDGKEIQESKHYHHVMKRLLCCLLLGRLPNMAQSVVAPEPSGLERWLVKLVGARRADIVAQVFDSVGDIVRSTQVDAKALEQSGVVVDPRKILKRENDRLLSRLIDELKKSGFKGSVIIDEIHFAFKEKSRFDSDATLVRDLIDAAQQLNTRFRRDGVGVQIYLGVRAEFLENPIISASEINNTIASVAHRMSWATLPFNNRHPCLDVIRKRVFTSMSSTTRPQSYRQVEIEKTYLANTSTDQFLRGVYGKPREAVRFFCVAKAMYPKLITLGVKEFAAVFREYSNQAWSETQTSLSSFLGAEEIVKLEEVLRKVAVMTYDKSVRFTEVEPMFKDYWSELGVRGGAQTFEAFMRSLYMLGVYYTSFDSREGKVFHAYYRGNSHPSHDGNFCLSDAVERKFR